MINEREKERSRERETVNGLLKLAKLVLIS